SGRGIARGAGGRPGAPTGALWRDGRDDAVISGGWPDLGRLGPDLGPTWTRLGTRLGTRNLAPAWCLTWCPGPNTPHPPDESPGIDRDQSSGSRCPTASSSTQSSSSQLMPFLPGTLRVGPAL